MAQYEPRVIYEDDIPDVGSYKIGDGPETQWDKLVEKPPGNFVEDLISAVTTPTEATPTNPKDMYRHLLQKAQGHAVTASENAYEACDWYALFDKATADRYRKSARHL